MTKAVEVEEQVVVIGSRAQMRTLVPSFNVATHPISDAATLVRPTSPRNLAPDQTGFYMSQQVGLNWASSVALLAAPRITLNSRGHSCRADVRAPWSWCAPWHANARQRVPDEIAKRNSQPGPVWLQ